MFELLHAADVSEVQSVGEVHQALVQYFAARQETPKSIALPQEQARNTLLNPGSWGKSLERLREGSRVMGKWLGIRAGV